MSWQHGAFWTGTTVLHSESLLLLHKRTAVAAVCRAPCDAEAEAGDGPQLSAHHRGGGRCCLKTEFGLVLILPSAAASRLSREFFFSYTGLFILPASPAVALPPQPTTVHNSGWYILQRED